ncbi:P-loop containing nucleoside triphosphate hydrolase protein [Myxozyma melibiosi]|uniref:RNA helicase n=1 Tax=Myxozyma melibiosi TaxID=54550 RepID=A0ABR1FC25_9ASCO
MAFLRGPLSAAVASLLRRRVSAPLICRTQQTQHQLQLQLPLVRYAGGSNRTKSKGERREAKMKRNGRPVHKGMKYKPGKQKKGGRGKSVLSDPSKIKKRDKPRYKNGVLLGPRGKKTWQPIFPRRPLPPSRKQLSRWTDENFIDQKRREKQFYVNHETTPADVGPPNAAQFGVLYRMPLEERLPLNETVARLGNFKSLRILPSVRSAVFKRVLNNVHKPSPTPVQALAIFRLMRRPLPEVRKMQEGLLPYPSLEGFESDEDYYRRKALRRNLAKTKPELKTYLIAAETGSGKTLAYLMPLMSMLKEEETTNAHQIWGIDSKPYIRSVILLPTAELVKQVLTVVKELSHEIKLSSAGLSKETSRETANNIRGKQIDILVTTPIPLIRLMELPNSGDLLENCRKIFIDEADSLMDRSFKEQTMKIINAPPRLEKAVFCSATIPKSFDRTLRRKFPNIERIVAPHLHQIPQNITFSTVDTSEEPFYNDKRKALLQTLYNVDKHESEGSKIKRVVVFMNQRESVSWLVGYLNGWGITAEGLTRDNTIDERSRIMREFRSSSPSVKTETGADLEKGKMNAMRVLVTTDIFSRGIDMKDVRTVILYDIPFSSIDLIHRAGRTGRMGNKGRVILLASKNELQPWLRGLGTTINRGWALV